MGPHENPSLGRTEFRICLLVLLVSFVPGSGRAQSTDICGPTPAVKAALEQLPDYRESPTLTDWQVHQQRLATLQALLRQYSDVQFITLSIDDNPGLIQPFLKEHQLSLVVIPAHDYAMDKLNVHGIPQSWIVDGNGVVRLKGFGYDTTEKWASSIKEAIERVRPGATASSASTR